jgi:3-hydroxyacyl-[acyl-carrier-protein] dehydratase
VRFILVDKIVELEPGRSIKAAKTFRADEEFFLDHFPGFPVVPGVLLTEMMAQAAGKCLVAEDSVRGVPMLAQIKAASFREWVLPGELAMILCDIRSSRAQVATAVGRVEVNGRLVCSADLLFSFIPAARFAPDYRDEVLTQYMASRQ